MPGLLLVLVVIMEASATLLLPKAVGWDPSYGMLAASKYVANQSPDLLTRVEANPEDISQDQPNRVLLWAPGYQVIPWLLRLGRFSWGRSLNLTVFLSLSAGLAGWGIYFARILPRKAALWLLLVLALSRYTMMNAVLYTGGDLLLWAAAPHLLLANVTAIRQSHARTGWLMAFLAGAGASGIYLIKYSALFLLVGLFVAWCWLLLRRRVSILPGVMWVLGAGVVGIPICLLGFTSTGATSFHGFQPLRALLSLGLWPEGMTGLEQLLSVLLAHLRLADDCVFAAAGLGLLGLIVVSLVCAKFRAPLHIESSGADETIFLGFVLAMAKLLLLACGMFAGSNISLHGRLGRVAGLLLLPILMRIWMDSIQSRGLRRLTAIACIIVFLVVPSIYGLASVASKLVAAWHRKAAQGGELFVTDISLSPGTDQKQFYAELKSNVPDDNTVVYSVYPQMFFPIPRQRLILVEAVEMYSAEELRQMTYRGSAPAGVALLLPRLFAGNGKLEAIQGSFAGVPHWTYTPLESDPFWGLWIGR